MTDKSDIILDGDELHLIGDVLLKETDDGSNVFEFLTGVGTARVGGGGADGGLTVRGSDGDSRIVLTADEGSGDDGDSDDDGVRVHLDGEEGHARIGGNGEDGSLSLQYAEAPFAGIFFDAETGTAQFGLYQERELSGGPLVDVSMDEVREGAEDEASEEDAGGDVSLEMGVGARVTIDGEEGDIQVGSIESLVEALEDIQARIAGLSDDVDEASVAVRNPQGMYNGIHMDGETGTAKFGIHQTVEGDLGIPDPTEDFSPEDLERPREDLLDGFGEETEDEEQDEADGGFDPVVEAKVTIDGEEGDIKVGSIESLVDKIEELEGRITELEARMR